MESNDASRIISVIDKRIEKHTNSEAQTETTWGEVCAISDDGKYASAYLYGETETPSADFRLPNFLAVSVGDKVKVAWNTRGERWVYDVMNSSPYRKVEINPNTGEILTGDGTAAPTPLELGLPDDVDVVNDLTVGGNATVTGSITALVDVVSPGISFPGDAGEMRLLRSGPNELFLDNADFVMDAALTVNGATLVDSLTVINDLTVDTDMTVVGDLSAGSASLGSGRLARFVPLDSVITSPNFASTTSDIGTTVLELTALPATGVVAVAINALFRTGQANVGNFPIYGYKGDRTTLQNSWSVIAYGWNNTNQYSSSGGVLSTGGTNNRCIAYSVSVGTGTAFYAIRISGYWTTE